MPRRLNEASCNSGWRARAVTDCARPADEVGPTSRAALSRPGIRRATCIALSPTECPVQTCRHSPGDCKMTNDGVWFPTFTRYLRGTRLPIRAIRLRAKSSFGKRAVVDNVTASALAEVA